MFIYSSAVPPPHFCLSKIPSLTTLFLCGPQPVLLDCFFYRYIPFFPVLIWSRYLNRKYWPIWIVIPELFFKTSKTSMPKTDLLVILLETSFVYLVLMFEAFAVKIEYLSRKECQELKMPQFLSHWQPCHIHFIVIGAPRLESAQNSPRWPLQNHAFHLSYYLCRLTQLRALCLVGFYAKHYFHLSIPCFYQDCKSNQKLLFWAWRTSRLQAFLFFCFLVFKLHFLLSPYYLMSLHSSYCKRYARDVTARGSHCAHTQWEAKKVAALTFGLNATRVHPKWEIAVMWLIV